MIDMLDLLVLFTELDGEYAIQVRSPDVGETPQPLPRVDHKDLVKIGQDLLEARKKNREEARVASLGKELFSRLFQGANLSLYHKAQALSGISSRPIRLLLAMASRSPLQFIPWELLHDGNGFLARDLRCAIVRYMEGENPVCAIALKPPVRILVTAACPKDIPKLNLESEIQGIYAAYEKHRRVTIFRYYDKTSLQDLRELLHDAVLAGHPFHVWHHCGHGGPTDASKTGDYRLFLERNRRSEHVSIASILGILRRCVDLRLVILNVCSGASAAGLAPELAQINVPSVVSFSSPIGDAEARTFALALHHGLLTLPIEIAADIARESICKPDLSTWQWSHLIHFSRRSDSGPLLEHSHRPPRKKPRIEKIYEDIIKECRKVSN
jgi:hypothetical protein